MTSSQRVERVSEKEARSAQQRGHAARAPSADAERTVPVSPPFSNTGVEITLHWLRGGFDLPESDVLDLVNSITEGGYTESFDWGRMMYRKHHVFVGGLTVYTNPVADNMPKVMVDAPGAACEFLGLDNLRVLFCNADLSRADIAYDHAPFTPREMASWVAEGNVRTRAKSKRFTDGFGGGDTLYIGSRSSEQHMRCYDQRGFTRVELETKGETARAFKDVLLSENTEFVTQTVGMLREFVDFVDASSSSNISRAPLLQVWEEFTQGLERVKIRVTERIKPTVERVVTYIEDQVAATLYTYHRLGYNIGDLLQRGKKRMKSKHRTVLAYAGAT